MTHADPVRVDLDPLLAAIQAAFPEVVGVWLFGSHAAGRARADSDIDLAVLARRPLDPVAIFDVGLQLGVLARRDVDLIDLRRASTVLRKVVIDNGRRIACADSVACDRFGWPHRHACTEGSRSRSSPRLSRVRTVAGGARGRRDGRVEALDRRHLQANTS